MPNLINRSDGHYGRIMFFSYLFSTCSDGICVVEFLHIRVLRIRNMMLLGLGHREHFLKCVLFLPYIDA